MGLRLQKKCLIQLLPKMYVDSEIRKWELGIRGGNRLWRILFMRVPPLRFASVGMTARGWDFGRDDVEGYCGRVC